MKRMDGDMVGERVVDRVLTPGMEGVPPMPPPGEGVALPPPPPALPPVGALLAVESKLEEEGEVERVAGITVKVGGRDTEGVGEAVKEVRVESVAWVVGEGVAEALPVTVVQEVGEEVREGEDVSVVDTEPEALFLPLPFPPILLVAPLEEEVEGEDVMLPVGVEEGEGVEDLVAFTLPVACLAAMEGVKEVDTLPPLAPGFLGVEDTVTVPVPGSLDGDREDDTERVIEPLEERDVEGEMVFEVEGRVEGEGEGE